MLRDHATHRLLPDPNPKRNMSCFLHLSLSYKATKYRGSIVQDAAYWCSWALSHFATLAASMLLCAVISLYPFRHSSFTVLLAILWLVAAALIAFAYFMGTLFSTSRVAGIAAAMLYSLSMVPGWVSLTALPPLPTSDRALQACSTVSGAALQ